ncbi:MAG: MobA/MobL family protein, partial [Xanthobacteraceae bacterium]
MAIYHFQAQRIARGNGRNAVRAAAYRHREQMRDELTGERYAYTGHREELIHSEIALPDETPQWLRTLVDGRTPAQASAALWNKVQAQATRANAIYAREIVIGLPTELNRDEQVALMRDYVRAAFTSRGMVADWVIHAKAGNPHAHVML